MSAIPAEARPRPRGDVTASIDVRPFVAETDAARDQFVRAHPRGTFFHLSGWRRAVERAFGHAPRDLVATVNGELAGVLPLMRCRGLFGGAHLISTPYAVYGGPLGRSSAVDRALCESAGAIAERERVGRLELRCLQDLGLDLGRDLVPSDLYATFIQELPADPADVMKHMPKRGRAEVRKAIEKHGLVLDEGPQYFDALVANFHASKQALGSPGLPAAWFRALMDEFGSDVVLHGVKREGETVAATMSFVYGDTFVFYYIGTTHAGNRTYNATNFLCTRLREWAVEKGYKRFDLSRSRRDSGPYHFKEHQGFEATPLAYRYKLVKSTGLPSLTPSNPRTKKLRDTWAKLPPSLARFLSGRLARYLP